jgi:hypothetical protein
MITVIRTDENGRTEAELADVAVIHELLNHWPEGQGCCLRFVDPYGDTIFNALQIPTLASEIRLAANGGSPELRTRADALATFIEAAVQKVHVYVKSSAIDALHRVSMSAGDVRFRRLTTSQRTCARPRIRRARASPYGRPPGHDGRGLHCGADLATEPALPSGRLSNKRLQPAAGAIMSCRG